MSESLANVILSTPSFLALADDEKRAKRSWIQLARTGKFVSNRYGKFEISKQDLSQMLHNFNEVTPKSPTELPVDYDHLSMDVKRPGDGIAAGWMKALELRKDGEELWAEVEWTPTGAERIANQEYRFVSPSFVKDHVHKDGKKIGTTLLAAAVTNHPFLEQMKALTLYNFSAHGYLALSADLPGTARAISLAEVGQRVMIAPGNARTQDEIGGTFEIAEVIGDGDDSFVSVKDAGGLIHKWFRMTELLPASTVPANPAHPGLQPGQTPVIPAQMPGVPVQPTTQAVDPAQAKNAAATAAAAALGAAGGVPGAAGGVPGAPGAVPPDGEAKPGEKPADGEAKAGEEPKAGAVKAGAVVGAIPPAGAAPNPFAKPVDPAAGAGAGPIDKRAKKAAAKQNEGATGTGEAAAAPTDETAIDEMLKKALAGISGANLHASPPAQQKGNDDMMFTLRNDQNQEVKVTEEQLAAAGVKVVPEGSTAIPTSQLTEMQGTITNLSSTVSSLKADNEARSKETRVLELRNLLGVKVRGGFMTKAQHDTLFDQFKDVVDLTAIKAIVATFTTPVITLNKEHGTGNDAHTEPGEAAQGRIIELSNKISKDRGISLSDATKLAAAQLADDAESYREHYATQ